MWFGKIIWYKNERKKLFLHISISGRPFKPNGVGRG
jgi:hypothetical protein